MLAAALMSLGRLQALANTMSLPGHAPACTAARSSACKALHIERQNMR